jgi:hypothetical protein
MILEVLIRSIIDVLVGIIQVEKYRLSSLHILFYRRPILYFVHFFEHNKVLFLNLTLSSPLIIAIGPYPVVDHPLSQLLIDQCLR